jgi:hypothetical protein
MVVMVGERGSVVVYVVGKVKDIRSVKTAGEVVLEHGADPVLVHGAVEAGGTGTGTGEVMAAGRAEY